MDSRLKNLSPKQAKKILELHGFCCSNIRGDHYTYVKKTSTENIIAQVIDNNKQCYLKNVKEMIRKSKIPEKVWANYKAIIKKLEKFINL